jgi:hypothetical protein
MKISSQLLPAVSLVLFALTQAVAAQDALHAMQTVKLERGAKQYIGALLAEDADNYVLLQRDGRMKVVSRSGSSHPTPLLDSFAPFTAQAMQQALKAEFGKEYEVSQTEHYLVVHPIGKARQCAEPFEEQYINARQYFEIRGVPTRNPDFPLVAVVLNTRGEFDRFLENYQPENAHDQVLGYYSPRSNRTITYDQTFGRSGERNNMDTLIHEATHQIAFNTGIHSRFSPMPRWFTEGLATMFEAPGVHSSVTHPNLQQRFNKKWLSYIRSKARPGESTGVLAELISSDELFRSNPEKAYGYAWALTFYLAETQPEKYAQYVRRVSHRTHFRDYSSQARIEDFARIFGHDFTDLEARVTRFLVE